MRWSRLILIILSCLVGMPNHVSAQGAATGGTRDVGTAPTMVFPRDEPRGTTAVPNNPSSQQRVIRLRRAYPIRSRGWAARHR
jgi:hypothetical protein